MKANRSKSVIQSAAAGRDGFTLLELVVVLGMMAVLCAVALPVLAGTKSQTKIGVCASHVRQLALACQIYANENTSRLPAAAPSGLDSANWAWDLPFSAGKALLKYGATKSVFYCPGTTPRFTDLDDWQDVSAPSKNLWDFGDNSWPPQNATGGFHITGYAFTLAGPLSKLNQTNQNVTLLDEALHHESAQPAIPAGMTQQPVAERVLLADATISSNSSDQQGPTVGNYNFTQIVGGFYKPHSSPHLKGNVPAGGNIAFKDGHVAWRNFKDMQQRAYTSTGFWW